jgi:outer membrane protein
VRRAREAQDGRRVPAGERTVSVAECGLGPGTTLNLDAAVSFALAHLPAIVEAGQACTAAAARAQQAEAARRPSLDASASYRRATSNAEGKPSSTATRGSYGAGLDLSLLLYDFGRAPAAIREAREGAIAAVAALRAAENDAVLAVRTAFFELVRAQELLQVAEEAERQYGEHLRQVQAFAEVGKRIRYDVTKAEVDLGNARLATIDARSAVATARATLNRSLGLAGEPGYRTGGSPTNDVSGGIDELMARARSGHPEMAVLQARVRAASAAVDGAVADLYPNLSLRGSIDASGGAFPLPWNWALSLPAALGLWSGGAKEARVDAAVADLRTARARFADREQQVYLDLSRGLSRRDSARERRQLTELILRQARESLDLVNERYRLGRASAVEVTDAQVAFTQAQAERVKAHFDLQAAVAEIDHAAGGESR